MRHVNTVDIYNYWNSIRKIRKAPTRIEVEPSKIINILPQTFILECANMDLHRFRLAGTGLCHQFRRELRGINLLDLWSPDDRGDLKNLLFHIVEEAAIGIVEFTLSAEQQREVNFEMILLPLSQKNHVINRVLGSTTAIEHPFWLGSQSQMELKIQQIKKITPDTSSQKISATSFGIHEGENKSSDPHPC